MLFHSQIFLLVFLPVFLVGYFGVSRHETLRKLFLLGASMVFYAAWDVDLLPLLLGSIALNFIVSRAISVKRLSWAAITGVFGNLLLLGIFKYSDFAASSYLSLLGMSHTPWNLALPLGISFFTFQQISYLIDRSRGQAPNYNALDYALFVSFFPQLVAGPIVRHSELVPQFSNSPTRDGMYERLSRGMTLFAFGLIKKLAVADQLSEIAAPIFTNALSGETLGLVEAWVGALAFGFQIYFDFSAYSDMAIGLALMIGIKLPDNFLVPYRAHSISEFWRRWHVTLSRFLRDYLYIPIGGNRRGLVVQCFALLVTMLLGGLWHGAAWTFVAWGALHGAALTVCHLWGRYLPVPHRLIGWILTLLFVFVAWVMFRAETFTASINMWLAMVGEFGLGGHTDLVSDWQGITLVILGAAILSMIGPTARDLAETRLRPNASGALAIGLVLAVAVLVAGGERLQDFIYFEF